ncbi:MAG: hypothetical protein CVT77_13160 [Alphaproteobacteria bacterium HGW-Alphaproteobacteria-16]|nr:MAG: hypothetical protein CVT77_13160 [Alphaproteobacteria bacterium HGW-Alphaproteobacteria-16]
MIVALSFWFLMLICCGFAAAFGGRSGRAIALVYTLNVIATWLVTGNAEAWRNPHLAAMLVDTALLIALIWIALRSDRWFPIWFAGLHLVATLSHLASALAPGFAPKIYFLLQSLWSLPMLVILVLGVARDRIRGVRDERSIPPAP